MPNIDGTPNARERRTWIVEPNGTVHPGHYACIFSRGGPVVPVWAAHVQPEDRSPRWVLRVGWTERVAFNPTELPELAGEPIDVWDYDAIYQSGEWRDRITETLEQRILDP